MNFSERWWPVVHDFVYLAHSWLLFGFSNPITEAHTWAGTPVPPASSKAVGIRGHSW